MFIGSQHQELLERIERRWADLLNGEREHPRLITMIGHQGVGKSRVVREFYGRLAARQSEPAYWPLHFAPGHTSSRRDPLPGRKVNGPPVHGFVWPPDALPDFFWWDLEADLNASGAASPALLSGEGKLLAHQPALLEAVLRRTGLWGRLSRRSMRDLRDLAKDQSVEQLGRLVTELTGAVVPGLGFTLDRLIEGWRYTLRRREATNQLAREVFFEDGAGALGAELAQQVRELSAVVPVVVVVEDAHWADDSLCALLRVLTATECKVLIVATAWPEGMILDGPHHVFASLHDDLLAAGRAEKWTLEPPALSEREALVRDFATTSKWDMPPTVITMLARRFVTPLGISLAMTSDFMQAFVDDGCDPEDLDEMPQALESLYQRRWEELDLDVQDVLVLASLLCPMGATSGVSDDSRVSLLFVLQLLSSVNDWPLPASQAMALAYERAKRDAAWLMEIAHAADQFREPELAAIAVDEAHRKYTRRRRNRVLAAYLEILRCLIADVSSPARELAAEHYLTLDAHLDDVRVPDDEHLGRAALVVSERLMTTYQVKEATSVLARVKGRLPESSRAKVLEALVVIYDGSSMFSEAAQCCRELLAMRAPIEAGYSASTASILADLLRAELELRHYAFVEQQVLTVLPLLPTVLDEPSIRLRRHRALAVRGDRKRLPEAIAMLNTLLQLQLGSATPSDLHIRELQLSFTYMGLSIAQSRIGDLNAALSAVNRAIEIRDDILGPDNPRTLAALGQKIAVLRDLSGREEEARVLRSEVYARRLQRFGPFHPQVLRSRHGIALASVSKDPQAAARELEEVHRLKSDILGPRHLSTILSLSAAAKAYRAAGDPQKSLTMYDEALALKVKVDSVQSQLVTRRNRLATLRLIDCAAALIEAEHIVCDAERELGKRSVGALRARFERAATLAHCEGRQRGLTAHEEVLRDRRAWLDPGHGDIEDSEATVELLRAEVAMGLL